MEKKELHFIPPGKKGFLGTYRPKEVEGWRGGGGVDLGDGRFSERCDVDGSFFYSDVIPIIFGKA